MQPPVLPISQALAIFPVPLAFFSSCGNQVYSAPQESPLNQSKCYYRYKWRGLPLCKNLTEFFSLFVAIVRARVCYVDFFVFFVLRHW